eukprot:jgi/Orpsp1_1/1186948/evm.model.d7180000054322.1
MFEIQNDKENEILMLPSATIEKKEKKLEYLSDRYLLKIQLKEDTKEKIILFSVEKETTIEKFIYEVILNYEELKKLGGLFVLCNEIKEIFNVILNSINKNKIYIKEIINEKSITLSLSSEVTCFDDPIITDIKLLKKDLNNKDLINKLYTSLEEKKMELDEITKMKSFKSVNYADRGTFTIYPSDGYDSMKEVSVSVDINTPVIDCITLSRYGRFSFDYSLELFKEVVDDTIVSIPPGRALIYIILYNEIFYKIVEIVNTYDKYQDFSFKDVKNKIYYQQINFDLKYEEYENHKFMLKDKNDKTIQYFNINNNITNKLVKTQFTFYRKYIDLSLYK